MRRLLLSILFLCLCAPHEFAQTGAARTPTTPQKAQVKQVQVTAQTLTRQRGYVIDLTRKGTIYAISPDVDHGRVRIRTPKGDMSLSELLAKSGRNVSGQLRVGVTSTMRAWKFGGIRGAGGLNYDCGSAACGCSGDDDCNDMFGSGKCGQIAVCYPDGCFCLRI